MSAGLNGFSDFPLAVGEIYGVRTWTADEYGRLRGRSYDAVWTPGENVATCAAEHEQGVVDPECGCGFWAYHNDETYGGDGVIGVIKGYGRTIAGTRGFRCEKAEVVAIALATDDEEEEPASNLWDRFCLWSDRSDAIYALGAAFGIAGMACVFVIAAWLWAAPVAAVFFFALALCVRASFRGIDLAHQQGMAEMRQRITFGDGYRQPTDTARRLRRNYPDAEFFTSVKAMRSAFPIKAPEPPPPPPEPSPDNDPEFWTRDVNSAPSKYARGGLISVNYPPTGTLTMQQIAARIAAMSGRPRS